ncbi:MAG TPA: phosphotransferase family protein [Phototrophicaceae bacterium]|nr:phosphotransferase family protein [Phototrophicaceae bacterium]
MADILNQDDFRQRLTEYLEAVLGEPVELQPPQLLISGINHENWLLRGQIQDQPRQFVLRRDLAADFQTPSLTHDQEFSLMQAAAAAGVRVPTPRWFCTETAILGTPFMLMDYIEGVSLGAEVVSLPELAAARRVLPEQMGQQLARIHAIKTEQLTFLPRPGSDQSPAQAALHHLNTALNRLEAPNPALTFALRWAEQHLPPTGDVVLLHGDFRLGNFIVNEAGLKGIVDWEFSQIGDPCQDLAWPCVRSWRYGDGQLPLGGFAAREPFISAYEAASGRTIRRETVDFWEIMGNLRRAIGALIQANRYRASGTANVEFANLGRRSAEIQLEALRLIAEQGV